MEDIQTERELRLAHNEMRQRLQWAAEERLARQAQQAADTPNQSDRSGHSRPSLIAWLWGIAGAR